MGGRDGESLLSGSLRRLDSSSYDGLGPRRNRGVLEPRGALLHAVIARRQRRGLVDRFPGLAQLASIEGSRRAHQAAVEAPAAHPQLKALPLLGGSVRLMHVSELCKDRARPGR